MGDVGVFKGPRADELAASDSDHWWFRSKASYVVAVARSLPGGPRRSFVDLGGGAGGVTAALRDRLGVPVLVEGSRALATVAHDRHGLPSVVATTDHSGLRDGCADLVTLLDVIEHLPDPAPTLREARRLLRPGGAVIVTVPAHPRLWSEADELLGHVRRYTRQLLREQLVAAGFAASRPTHVFSWLVAPVWLRRRHASTPEASLGLDQRSRVVDGFARALTAIEAPVARRIALPFGTSIIGVATRPVDIPSS